MIISEVNAVMDLVDKAISFCKQARDGWYEGSSELDSFEEKVLMLDAKHSQWKEQLQRHGISEDKRLLLAVKQAEKALEKQQQSMRKLQGCRYWRFNNRVVPGKITYLFDQVLQIVDAGPQLLATKVANNELLERYAAQSPTSLPFDRDRNYVPIVSTISKVQRALESAEERRVVTLFGLPGMGKSCLAKHLAIHYQEENEALQMDTTSQKPAVFPDGVYYVFCGRQADKRVKQLQLELLQRLGFGTGYATSIDSATSSVVHYAPLPSYDMTLKSRLGEQKLLIILDDLWEETVLQEILVPVKGVKYLVTSQSRDIFFNSKKIRIERPTEEEARSIMANYTDGLPIRGQFPPHIQRLTDDIIQTLQRHPLSLANIGMSINSSRVTDTSQWEVTRENLYLQLDENDRHKRRPPAYDRPYGLPVSASMMLMVESVPLEEQRLLFLMALLGGQRLPEPLVKFFYSFIHKNSFALKYNSHKKFLEDNSLIEIERVEENRSLLDCHSLRSHYIRDKKTLEVRSLGSQILIVSLPNQDTATPIRKGDEEGALALVLGSIYYHQDFRDDIENHVKVLNSAGTIPRSLWNDTEVVHSARTCIKYEIDKLVWLLNVDHKQAGGWRSQAHEYAKKIIIKFVCRGEFDEHSMANLLALPQTTLVAWAAMNAMLRTCHREDY